MTSGATGRADFVARHELSNPARDNAIEAVIANAQADNIEVVRISFVDQHGLLRGKTLPVNALADTFRNGCTMTSTLLLKDTSHRTVFPVWHSDTVLGTSALSGAGDIVMVPDPSTYRLLPWSPQTGWLLADIYLPSGDPLALSTRRVLQREIARADALGLTMQVGLEVEFHVFKLEDAHLDPIDSTQPARAPTVRLTTHGYQYLTESRADEMEPVTELIRDAVQRLGLPLRSIEVEFGPSQYEFTFHPGPPLEQADAMVLFRSAVKQVCRRAGYHATFMCRPALPNIFASGWHLHQSLIDKRTGVNALVPDSSTELLSPLGRHYVAGLLEHAMSSTVLAAPTLNAYKRYQANSMAPDRVTWSHDNKGALLRVIGGENDPATRIENRLGEPSANPYLYIASQLTSGLAGIETNIEPPAPEDAPYQAAATALPRTLQIALDAFRQSTLYRQRLGDLFVDYYTVIKQAEIDRFMATVTDWEHQEYFDTF